MSFAIGIDLGGTKIAGVLYDTQTEAVVERATVPTMGQRGVDAVIARMGDVVRTIASQADLNLEDIVGVGVGVPATVDYDTGRTILLPNIPGDWYNKPVAELMQRDIDRPVWLINDARAFTLAEANIGAGRGYPVVAGFTLGTGIGGGIAVNGEVLLGNSGGAGEFGHMCIDVNGSPDGSGTPGGLEGYCSGPSIAAMGAKAVMQGVNTRIGALVDYDLNRITPAVIAQAADEGDEIAQGILKKAGEMLGAGIAVVLTVIDPHAVIIGGGMSRLGDRLLDSVRTALPVYNRTVNIDRLTILMAELGEEAGAIGAAMWALKQGQ